MKPMLATEVSTTKILDYVEDNEWFFQPKLDGQRVLVTKDGYFGRDGQSMEPKLRLVQMKAFVGSNPLYDCELIKNILHVFDYVPSRIDPNYISSFSVRNICLMKYWNHHFSGPGAVLVPTARTYEDKVAMVRTILAENGEGIIARHRNSEMLLGQRSKKVIKLKFCHEIDAKLVPGMQQGSASIFVRGSDRAILIGSVKTQGWSFWNNNVATIRFLSISSNDRLVQPRIVAIRHDKSYDECLLSQLDPFRKVENATGKV